MTFIPNSEFKYDVALSKVPESSTVNKFGYNNDIDTAADEGVASFGGSINIMTSADTLDVVSDSILDAVGGAGCSYILITGIGASHAYQEEYITLTGTTTVTTSNTWLGVNRVYAITTGTNNANVGTITLDDNAGTVGTQAEIPPNSSVTQQCIFHTQINHTLLLDWMIFGALKLSGGSSPRVTFKGFSYSRVTDTIYEVFKASIDTAVENHLQLTPSQPFVIGGKEVFWLEASTNTNNTEVNARFSGLETQS